jgi:hypothetical protein
VEVNAKAMRKAVDAIRRRDWLDQPALSFVQICVFAVGALFWMEAYHRPEAFDVAIFGEFAVRFPAEMWAGGMMGAAAIVWIGLQDPVKRWMVSIGAGIQTVQFTLLAYSAIATAGEDIIGYWASVLFAPLYARIALEALRDA